MCKLIDYVNDIFVDFMQIYIYLYFKHKHIMKEIDNKMKRKVFS